MDSLMLREFFGWCTVINFAFYVLMAAIIIPFQKPIAKIHSMMMNVQQQDLPKIYMNYLANYKLFTIFFSLVPYIALTLMGDSL